MNELINFNYKDVEVRTGHFDNEEPYFVAKDVCKALEIKNVGQAVSRLDDDEKGIILTDTPGGMQNLTAVNESGLYTLIMSSRKKEARTFQKWVTKEVLPSIRKHGAYATDQLLDNPDFAIEVFSKLKEEREKRKALEIAKDLAVERSKNLGEKVLEQNLELIEKDDLIESMQAVCEYAERHINVNAYRTFTDLGQSCGKSAISMRQWMQDQSIVRKKKQNGHWTLTDKYAKMRNLWGIDTFDQEMDNGTIKRRYSLKFTETGVLYFETMYNDWRNKLRKALESAI